MIEGPRVVAEKIGLWAETRRGCLVAGLLGGEAKRRVLGRTGRADPGWVYAVVKLSNAQIDYRTTCPSKIAGRLLLADPRLQK